MLNAEGEIFMGIWCSIPVIIISPPPGKPWPKARVLYWKRAMSPETENYYRQDANDIICTCNQLGFGGGLNTKTPHHRYGLGNDEHFDL